MISQRLHNPHLQILLFSLFLLFYNYYYFALNSNSFVITHHLNGRSIYFILIFSPFAFSSLARPFGGIIASFWQRKSKHYILPILLVINGMVCLIIYSVGNLIYMGKIAMVVLILRIIQGLLLGGIVPQYFVYFYERSRNLSQNVLYSTSIFVTYNLVAICSEFMLHYIPSEASYWLNIIIALIYTFIAIILFRLKYPWNNFKIAEISIMQSLSLWHTLKNSYGSIIRFTLFLSFMASVSSLFFTVIPFYLVNYLNYRTTDVFLVVTITTIVGISGFGFGSYYHIKIGKKWHLTLGLLIKVILYFLFRVYINHNLLLIEILGSICLFCTGLMLAKISLILNSIFKPRERLFGISITYNLSFGLMYGFLGFIIIELLNHFHNLYIPSLIIAFFSYLSLASLCFTPEKDFYRYLKQ